MHICISVVPAFGAQPVGTQFLPSIPFANAQVFPQEVGVGGPRPSAVPIALFTRIVATEVFVEHVREAFGPSGEANRRQPFGLPLRFGVVSAPGHDNMFAFEVGRGVAKPKAMPEGVKELSGSVRAAFGFPMFPRCFGDALPEFNNLLSISGIRTGSAKANGICASITSC